MGHAHILVVEDDPVARGLLAGYFRNEGYRVSETDNGDDVVDRLARDPAELVLLDIRLPGIDGLSLTRSLRASSHVGIILVTSKRDLTDRIVGLEMGADDYVTKPFEPRELLARARNLIRRVRQAPPPAAVEMPDVCFNGWRLEPGKRLLHDPAGAVTRLTEAEYQLLATLVDNAGQTLSRDRLLARLNGRDWSPTDRSVDVLLGRLRKKLGEDPTNPRLIVTVRGSGYQFTAGVTRESA
ncbi:MAG TPA: response regulator [Gammaproteobacteria bacterium]|nr:response regulator [Gammaproteobacteria bacterium]